jgi:hypothetical protein
MHYYTIRCIYIRLLMQLQHFHSKDCTGTGYLPIPPPLPPATTVVGGEAVAKKVDAELKE